MAVNFASTHTSLGFKNADGKYLTAEPFQFGIGATSALFKKKQQFFIEPVDDAGNLHIRSYLNRYMAVDGDGKLSCDKETPDADCVFAPEVQSDGRWAIKSASKGWFMGGSGGNLSAFISEIQEDRLWTVRLAMHPMFALRNVMRKRFVHLSGTTLTTDEDIPWGDDAVIQLGFNEANDTYSIYASNGGCLACDGDLKAARADDGSCDFIVNLQAGGVVNFRSATNGKFLTSLGASGLVRAAKGTAGTDESYGFEHSYPQITLKAQNERFVSIKQGIEVAAKGDDGETDNEIFQLEPLGGNKWLIKTAKDKLWDLQNGAVHAQGTPGAAQVDEGTVFEVTFENEHVSFKASNGKYVGQQMNSYLKADQDSITDHCKFTWSLANRPRLVLRGEHGFVYTTAGGGLEVKSSDPETFALEVNDGKCSIKSLKTGKFVTVAGDGAVMAAGDAPEAFFLELCEGSKLKIKTEDDKYFKGQAAGFLKANGGADDGEATLFQY